jgi:integrase
MRVGMGLIKNEHGVWQVRKKVPKRLEVATATVLGKSKERVSWLKETLRTKDKKQAMIIAKPVMMKFDRILADAEASLAERPLRRELAEAEIKQLADYVYASALNSDEQQRQEGSAEEDALFASVHEQLVAAGIEFTTSFEIEKPQSGLSKRMMHKIEENVATVLPAAREALARGNIDFIRYELNQLLSVFRINLDPDCADYRKAAMAVMRAEVRALEAIAARHAGEPIESPPMPELQRGLPSSGRSLRAAYDGWVKIEKRPASTVLEFSRGIERFIEFHGDLDVAQINRGQVRSFREAAQLVPKHRPGKLRKMSLPELVKWSRQHPDAVRISSATVNKWLTCLQAVLNWARENGTIPDDIVWADPVSNMRLPESRPNRQPWEPEELARLFSSPVFVDGLRPAGGKGEAAFWLPLLALFSGARLSELVPLTVGDIKLDVASGVRFMTLIEDATVGRSVKTDASVRAVPLHSELLKIGFVEFVERARATDGSSARLFPEIERGPKGTFGEVWSKWFGRYKRSLGIANENSVFHSFRHGFKDALRAAQVSEDINDALTGHAGSNRVARGYGWKDMVRRFGLPALQAAVQKVAYPGLDLSRIRWRSATAEDQEARMNRNRAAQREIAPSTHDRKMRNATFSGK